MQFTETLGAFFQQVAQAKLARAIDTDDALLLSRRELRPVKTERKVEALRRAA